MARLPHQGWVGVNPSAFGHLSAGASIAHTLTWMGTMKAAMVSSKASQMPHWWDMAVGKWLVGERPPSLTVNGFGGPSLPCCCMDGFGGSSLPRWSVNGFGDPSLLHYSRDGFGDPSLPHRGMDSFAGRPLPHCSRDRFSDPSLPH